MTRSTRYHGALALAIAAAIGCGSAHALSITREFSANWYDPSHSGHGFAMEVIDSPTGKQLLVNWFTYDKSGRPLWIAGTGPVVGDHASVVVGSGSGGSFDNQFDPKAVRIAAWGTLDVSFQSCASGSVTFKPNDASLPSGRIPIARLTQQFNSSCSGGVSDDMGSGGGNGTGNSTVTAFMTNTGVVAGATGRLRYRERLRRVDFDVEIEHLPAGNYDLRVAGKTRATIAVTTSATGGVGEIELRSPAEPGHPLLDFDPRGQTVEIAQGTSVILTAAFAGSQPPTGGGGGGAPPFGNAKYRLDVEPSGSRGPELSSKLEQRSDRVDFSVELDRIPAALYTLRVGGVERGTIDVRAIAGGTFGEIEFRTPQGDSDALLDFDPRGQLVDIVLNGAVVISGTFPTTPTGSSSGGNGSGSGSGSGGGSDDPPGDDHGGGSGGGGNDDPSGDDHGGGSNSGGGSGGGSNDGSGHG